MGIYAEDNYKETLKSRMKELQATRPSLTWKKLAAEVPVQYTYLSKALNDERTHLNEDHLFVVCQALEFFPEEIDYLLMQRAHDVAQDPSRKQHLFTRIEKQRRAHRLNAEEKGWESGRINEEIRYLFEPLSLVVHMALLIGAYKKDPHRLCTPLGISVGELREILRILSRNGFIDLDDDGRTVQKVHQARLHFGRDHVLMRYHQSLLKDQITSRLPRTSEENKHSFLVTFTMDDSSFGKIKNEFQAFLKKVEQIAIRSKDEHVYQLAFDLFKWV